MIVVDSSAVVAMLLGETAAEACAARLAKEPRESRIMSAANYVEAGTVLAGRHADPARGVALLDELLGLAGIALAPVDEAQARLALQARVRFGQGFGAAAGLNFGDCFAYALAKLSGAPLLFLGGDFAATDIEAALPA
ncbi:MAG: type II toxin-antitoxin system VapC family toxin [Caulobacteraceae bacterium]